MAKSLETGGAFVRRLPSGKFGVFQGGNKRLLQSFSSRAEATASAKAKREKNAARVRSVGPDQERGTADDPGRSSHRSAHREKSLRRTFDRVRHK